MITFFISLSMLSVWLDSFIRDIYGVKPGVKLEGQDISGLLREEVRGLVMEMAMQEWLLPQEPEIDKKTGRIIPEKPGIIVDVQSTINNVMQAQANQSVALVRNSIPSKYRSEDLEKLSTIGSYSTSIYGTQQRSSNIALAATALDNTVVWPDQVFSFNEIVGPRTPERGYLPAPVILMGANNYDYGGGVCQVSSTVYNAALAAELEIIERHPHSKPVHYVPANRDAAVAYGGYDLRIRNHTGSPIIIKSHVSEGRVWVSILGEEKEA
ncbi:MAG: VanW family protein [Syntrophomonadaceae bacterium]|jgi:vancomycin resistance protein YoaR|nr:VanW family protein [Bacillota bacterium]HQA49207.1 VanW family protein [Syntrophomonadaceae bacterium]HQD89398.1 VanW family protein [Syntrophomonadaceae bacterium]